MPTEMRGQAGEDLREKAHEYGTTTGRARRIGWFDAVAARYSNRINGFTGMVLTRLDILDGMNDVKICVGYRVDGKDLDRFPANTGTLERCEPIYEKMPGWQEPTASATRPEQLPANALAYVRRIEALVGCEAQIISTGPSRDETIAIDQNHPLAGRLRMLNHVNREKGQIIKRNAAAFPAGQTCGSGGAVLQHGTAGPRNGADAAPGGSKNHSPR